MRLLLWWQTGGSNSHFDMPYTISWGQNMKTTTTTQRSLIVTLGTPQKKLEALQIVNLWWSFVLWPSEECTGCVVNFGTLTMSWHFTGLREMSTHCHKSKEVTNTPTGRPTQQSFLQIYNLKRFKFILAGSQRSGDVSMACFEHFQFFLVFH